jgi:hypothetical protein
MSEGVPQPSQSSGGGSSNQGKWGFPGATSWWPLGVAGVTALLTAQAAAGVESENTYAQVSIVLVRCPVCASASCFQTMAHPTTRRPQRIVPLEKTHSIEYLCHVRGRWQKE